MPNFVDARWTDSLVALANGATFNGLARDRSSLGANRFRVYVLSDQAGTLNVQQSDDGVSWRTMDTAAIVASTDLVVESSTKWVMRYARAQVVNGGVSQGFMTLKSEMLEQ